MKIRFVFLIGGVLALAACGVDGEPERPQERPQVGVSTGLSIGGTVSFGIGGTL